MRDAETGQIAADSEDRIVAVSRPALDLLGYDEAGDLLAGVAARCRVVGAAFTELVPARDVNERSALVVARLVMRLIAGIARR